MMRKNREYALNKLFNVLIVAGVLFGMGAFVFLQDGNLGWGIGFGVVTLLLVVLSCFFTPYCYAFDKDGVSLLYLFSPTERYLWKNIHAIEVGVDFGYMHDDDLFDWLFGGYFALHGQVESAPWFFMEGHIRKSFRTKYLLEKYWDGTIEGYLFDDVKAWFRKRKNKKQAEVRAHLTDEVVPMERAVRAKAREWLKPFEARAKQHGWTLRTQYLYITRDEDELHSRPQKGYAYTAYMEISQEGETDENRIVCLSVDLLQVRLGKTAYRGVECTTAEEELRSTLNDVFQELAEHGFDVYCKDE